MKKILFFFLFSPLTEISGQWIGTRSSCNVTCMSDGYNPASAHIIWGDKGTYGAGLTFALEGELIVGAQVSASNGPVPRPPKGVVETPSYSVCGIAGTQFNPLCLSLRAGIGQYSRITSNGSSQGGPRKLMVGGYITVLVTDRLGLELGGDTFNGNTIGISYQF
jgi:hypothetical protein